MTISSSVSRASAAFLFAGGLTLLFAADVILPSLVPGIPPNAAWLGQLVASAWLGVAALNWMRRDVVLGGIYGRPVVSANMLLYFIGALSLVKPVQDPSASRALWALAVPMAVFGIVYAALLFRGPFDRLPGDGSRT